MTRRGWALARAGALAAAVVLLSPVNPLVLVAVPAALMLAAFRRDSPATLAAAGILLLLAFGGLTGETSPVWTAERGWALALGGGFVAVTAVRGRWSLTTRSLVAVAVASAAVALAGGVRPGLLAELDWWVKRQLGGAALAARRWLPDAIVAGTDGWSLQRAQAWQETLYPALLGLASLAALGVGGYAVRRLSGRREALAPFRDFGFTDRMAWVLAAGLLVLAAAPGGAAGRVAGNVVAFAGGLYLLRGVAVLYCVGAAAATSPWSAALIVIAGVLLYPLVLAAALLLGLGDTWIDVRGRLLGALGRRGSGR